MKEGEGYGFMGDVWAGLNYCYNPEAFRLRRGKLLFLLIVSKNFLVLIFSFFLGLYFPSLIDHTSKYIPKREKVRKWLVEMRESGVKLLLITNSAYDYRSSFFSFSFSPRFHSTLFSPFPPLPPPATSS